MGSVRDAGAAGALAADRTSKKGFPAPLRTAERGGVAAPAAAGSAAAEAVSATPASAKRRRRLNMCNLGVWTVSESRNGRPLRRTLEAAAVAPPTLVPERT